jgi:phosphoribosylamine-glycine ligase
MFINISNHSVSTWSQKQIEEAMSLGHGNPIDVEDTTNVSSKSSSQDIVEQAKRIVSVAMKQGCMAAMVQGENVLTTIIVFLLTKNNIPCYAAVSERNTVEKRMENGDVVKTAVFVFSGFRQYPVLF